MTIEMDGTLNAQLNQQVAQLPNIVSSTMLLPN